MLLNQKVKGGVGLWVMGYGLWVIWPMGDRFVCTSCIL